MAADAAAHPCRRCPSGSPRRDRRCCCRRFHRCPSHRIPGARTARTGATSARAARAGATGARATGAASARTPVPEPPVPEPPVPTLPPVEPPVPEPPRPPVVLPPVPLPPRPPCQSRRCRCRRCRRHCHRRFQRGYRRRPRPSPRTPEPAWWPRPAGVGAARRQGPQVGWEHIFTSGRSSAFNYAGTTTSPRGKVVSDPGPVFDQSRQPRPTRTALRGRLHRPTRQAGPKASVYFSKFYGSRSNLHLTTPI
jgi:hypothetical protein